MTHDDDLTLNQVSEMLAAKLGRSAFDAYAVVRYHVHKGSLPASCVEGATPRLRRYAIRAEDARRFVNNFRPRVIGSWTHPGPPVGREWRVVNK